MVTSPSLPCPVAQTVAQTFARHLVRITIRLLNWLKRNEVSQPRPRTRLNCENLEGRDVPSTVVEQLGVLLPNGQVLGGQFTYDTSQVTNAPSQQLTINNLSLEDNGLAYDETFGDVSGSVVADFQNGNYVGVQFTLLQSATGYPSIQVADGTATTVDATTGNQQQESVLYGNNAPPQVPVGLIDLSNLANEKNNFTLNLKLIAQDGGSTQISINITAGMSAENITKLVYDAIPKSTSYQEKNLDYTWTAGWTATLNANKTSISIYSGRKTTVTIDPLKEKPPGPESPIKDIDPAGTTSNQKVIIGITNPAPVNTPVTEDIVFGPNATDGTAVVQTTTTFDLNIDGVDVIITEQAGTAFAQVENDLFAQALTMGLTGISESGNTLMIANNFSGQPVGTVTISAATVNGSPESFIDTTMTYQ